MNITTTRIPGIAIVETKLFQDHRGWFYRAFCTDELVEILGKRQIVQINLSKTDTVGAIRGLHFQYPPHAEMKLIRCVRGAVWDVALDLRQESPTFLQWHAETLSAENTRMMVIPRVALMAFRRWFQGVNFFTCIQPLIKPPLREGLDTMTRPSGLPGLLLLPISPSGITLIP